MGKNEILNILKKYKHDHEDEFGIIELGLFGSVAREEDTEKSDVDLYIKTKSPDPFILVRIKEDIATQVHKSVDIVRLREKMNAYLKERIQTEGIHV